MTRKVEERARLFLLNDFRSPHYRFEDKQIGDKGFDLWLVNIVTGTRTMAELKAHTGAYRRPSDLTLRLIFNALIEKQLFENGDSVVVRVFLKDFPYRVFIINNALLNNGAELKAEPRFVLHGTLNYEKSFVEVTIPQP